MEKGEKKWYKSPGNLVTLVACIILVPMLLMNLWIIFQSKTNKDVVPSVFGIKPFIVLSGSMESKIHKGDLILTKEIEPTKVKIEDVIAFRDAEGTVTTHRVIDIVEKEGESYFITKGDNNTTQDRNLVALNDIEGIYIGRIPGIGSMMSSLSEPTTILILILGITIIFVIGFSISNKKQRNLERQEYLEFKKMKEEMALAKSSKTKKTKSIKAVEDEDDEDDELLDEDEEEEEIKPQPKKKKTPSSTTKTKTTKKESTSSKKTKSTGKSKKA